MFYTFIELSIFKLLVLSLVGCFIFLGDLWVFLSEFVLKAMGFMGYIFYSTPKFLETRIKNTKRKTINKVNFF